MSPPPVPVAGLATVLVLLVTERLVELRLSARHARALAARGGVENGSSHFPLLVALHVAWPPALVAEVIALGARPPHVWAGWLALLVAAQALRAWAIGTLGTHWTVGIWVVPGAPRVRHGPYRWLRHPNYLAVALELLAVPLLFGAWRTAVAATAVNAVALAIRIRAEERAWAGSGG